MKKVIVTAIITVLWTMLIVLLIAAGVARMGMINVAATAEYLPGAEWFFSTLSEQSIQRQAREAVEEGRITPPQEITASMLDNGRHHFEEMCVVCHGAPGVDRGEIGKGQKPIPPDLSEVAREMSIAEIYWVVEHGIRHTGMPAYGETHSANELWGIAAFVEQLENMSPEKYQRLTSKEAAPVGVADESPELGGHDHSTHTH
ncbi:MAG: cytochrome c [Acidobacteria bacterium]|nr:cytochrome c [Acidobacteriota bacterium]